MIRAALIPVAVMTPAYLLVAAAFALNVWTANRAAAQARAERPVSLPQRLTTRWADFDERGRSW